MTDAAATQATTPVRAETPGAWRYSPQLALVLSGGGARAAYQVGVLAGLAERLPGLAFPILTGVSAGAINAAYLAAQPADFKTRVAGLQHEWFGLTGERIYRVRGAHLTADAIRSAWSAATGRPRPPVNMHGLLDTQPLREFLTRAVDMAGLDRSISAGRLRALALSASSYTTGVSVTFVHGTADTPTWTRAQRVGIHATLSVEHIMASAALPIVFPAVPLGDDFYGDGSVSQIAPLAPAIHLGAKAIVAIGPTNASLAAAAVPTGTYPSAAEVLGLLFRAVFLDALEADAERLRRVNRTVAAFPAGTHPVDGLRPIALLLIRPSRELASFAQGNDMLLPRSVRLVVRAIGGDRAAAADFLGHLLFHPNHTSQLANLGYEDVAARWPEIETFFETLERTG
ncbi:MAG TPA: patatin-like phospholipase family protein [Gemmatimonadales bacterium]|nr:patatin-like phospholipase family protein [Gemmatimonadales bacterium]